MHSVQQGVLSVHTSVGDMWLFHKSAGHLFKLNQQSMSVFQGWQSGSNIQALLAGLVELGNGWMLCQPAPTGRNHISQHRHRRYYVPCWAAH